MKDKMKHFSTYIRAALACYVSMTPDQQALAMMYVRPTRSPHLTSCTLPPVRPAGLWRLSCCKICSNFATANNNAHFLRAFSVNRAISANKLKCQRKSTFSVDFSTENSGRIGIDANNQRFL